MKKVDITVCRAQDGTYSAYCNDHPALFGMGDTAAKAKEELEVAKKLSYTQTGWMRTMNL